MSSTSKYEINMCEGKLLPKILKFYFPIMASGVLQLVFNAADLMVVGNFCGDDSVAAVGSTTSLINLLVNILIGLAVGANVLVARYFGAGQDKELEETVHTSVMTALVGGIVMCFVGIAVSHRTLVTMATPGDILPKSLLYLRLYCLGIPASALYNFGSSVLRAVGDTKRPLYYLFTAGILNVILNLIFVILFRMDVAGVACATVISQVLSAFLILRCLSKCEGAYKLEFKKLSIKKDKLLKLVGIGLPAGLQGALFSLSNIVIQSSVNSFGKIVVAGNSAAISVEGFVYMAMNGVYQCAVSFAGQNYGAGKYKRIVKLAFICEGLVFFVGLILGNASYFFGRTLLGLYVKGDEAIHYGMVRLGVICTIYFLCGFMDTIVGVLRGMGYSIIPMFVSLSGACLFRIIWIMTVFKNHHELTWLYISYPISWIMTAAVHFMCFGIIMYRLITKKCGTEMTD
ncbi:MAG: MATE family efflux transporter [Lachnospiraceae bacterium]|nr:MATE family efflux transporter [Lachnospiraceae bacterium]